MRAGQRDQAQEWKSELTIFTIYIFVPFYFKNENIFKNKSTKTKILQIVLEF